MTAIKKKLRMFSMDDIEEAADSMAGFCLACGAWKDGCEPDARKYECDECGEHKVYGAEEIALMGRVE